MEYQELPVEIWHWIGYNYVYGIDLINLTRVCRACYDMFSQQEWKILCGKNGISAEELIRRDLTYVHEPTTPYSWDIIYTVFMRIKSLCQRDYLQLAIYYVPLYAMIYAVDMNIVYLAYRKYVKRDAYATKALDTIVMNNNICISLPLTTWFVSTQDVVNYNNDVPVDGIGKWARCRQYLVLSYRNKIKNLEKVVRKSNDMEMCVNAKRMIEIVRSKITLMPAPLKIQKILTRNALTEGIRLAPRRSFRPELLEILKQLCLENRSPDSILAEYRIIKYRKYLHDIIKSGAYRKNTKNCRHNPCPMTYERPLTTRIVRGPTRNELDAMLEWMEADIRGRTTDHDLTHDMDGWDDAGSVLESVD